VSLAALLNPPSQPSRCKVGAILAGLNDDVDRDALAAALANTAFPGRRIIAALRADGHQVSRTTLQDHRNGVCCCAAG
jgi:hypothetical protein